MQLLSQLGLQEKRKDGIASRCSLFGSRGSSPHRFLGVLQVRHDARESLVLVLRRRPENAFL